MVDTNSHLGEITKNNKGTEMKIIAYRKWEDIDVEFLDEHHYIFEHATYGNFKRGQVKSPFDRSVANVGYTGIGEFKTSIKKIHTVEYSIWKQMILRCYFLDDNNSYPVYYGISEVCEEWHNFQNFAKWYTSNSYNIGKERLHLDKDIKYYGNKIYSPYHCILVPQSINEQFKECYHFGQTNNNLPYTVRSTNNGKYESYHRGISLGTFNTIDEACEAYVLSKKTYINELVNRYKNMPTYVKKIILDAKI